MSTNLQADREEQNIRHPSPIAIPITTAKQTDNLTPVPARRHASRGIEAPPSTAAQGNVPCPRVWRKTENVPRIGTLALFRETEEEEVGKLGDVILFFSFALSWSVRRIAIWGSASEEQNAGHLIPEI